MGGSPHEGSIRSRLALVLLAFGLPLGALIAYLLYETSRRELAEAEAAVRRLADNGVDRAVRFLEVTRGTLETVARRPLVRALDPARCDPGLKDLLELTPRAVNFLVADREGRFLCGAIPPPRDRVVRVQEPALLARVLETGEFALSQPVIGRITQRWTVAAVVPVPGVDGRPAGAVSMSIDLLRWQPLPRQDNLPAGAVVALVSAGGTVLARSEDEDRWVGRDISAGELMQRMRGASAGTLRARGVAGIERIWAFRTVPGTDWIAVAGIDAAQVLAPVRDLVAKSALLIALALAAALALAWAAARGLSGPLRAIAQTLRLRAEGREELRVPVSGPAEVAAMARELNRGIERSERLRMQRERMPIACLVLDAGDRIAYANPAAERTFGYAAAEMLGRRPAELYVPAERHALVEALFARLRRGELVSATGESLRKDGTRIQVEWVATPLYREDGAYDGHLSMATDISERLRAEQRLALAQRMYAALLEVNEAIVRVREREALFRQVCEICVARVGLRVAFVALLEEDGRRAAIRVVAGDAAGVLTGVAFGLEPGAPLSQGVTPQAVRTHRAAVANDAEHDPARSAARALRDRLGSKSTASFPLFLGERVIGALTLHSAVPDFFGAELVALLQRMADDLSFALDKMAEQDKLATLSRELEERVRRRTAELEAANQELEAFSYSVSHDLRAPVRHVDGFVRLLEKEVPSPSARAAHYFDTISAAARRMGSLIDDLLQLSRTARQALALRRVELGPLVRELAREAAAEAGARRIDWAIGELPAAMADPALLRVVLQNLLSNAVKYTRQRPLARIAVAAERLATGELALTVRDNGVGFDMRFQEKLFGVFQRLHRDEEFEGTGIGLATARRIVHRHGHRIWAAAVPGEGASFTFTLTAAEVVHEGIPDPVG